MDISSEALALGPDAEPMDPFNSGSLDLPPERTLAFGDRAAPIAPPGRAPVELPPEKTVAFGQGDVTSPMPHAARRPAAISVPSSAGIRLAPDVDRFFTAPQPASNPAIVLPSSPFEPPPSQFAPPAVFTPPPGHDPFVAQPPPPGVAATPEALGKPSPKRWILPLVIGFVVIAVTITAIALVATRSGPATLEVMSVPPGASVQVDGLVIPGETPLTIPNVEADHTYRISLMRRGYEPREADVTVDEGQNRSVFLLNPVRVTLHIETQPPGAQVWVDNTLRGSAPLDIAGLAAGQLVMLRASAPGHESVHQQVTLDETDTSPTVTLELRPNAPP
jgi:hypothetical protein